MKILELETIISKIKNSLMWVKLRSDQVKGRISEVEDDQHENKYRGRKQTKECQRYVGYNEGSNTYMTEVPEENERHGRQI